MAPLIKSEKRMGSQLPLPLMPHILALDHRNDHLTGTNMISVEIGIFPKLFPQRLPEENGLG